MAKEKCAKESQRHGDSRGGPPRFASRASSCGSPFGAVLVLGSLRSPAGKKASTAHFGGGARYVARSGVGQLTHAIVRARSSPFSAVKMGGPFSLRCLSPLCSPAVGSWQAHPLQGGMLRCILGIFAAAMNGLLFLFPDDGRQAHTLHGGLLRRNLGIFATPKASVKSNPRWPLLRAMRPVAEWRSLRYNCQGAAPNPRAARPVAEQR